MFKPGGLPPSLITGGCFLKRAMTKTAKSSNKVPGNPISVASPSEVCMWSHALSIVDDAMRKKEVTASRNRHTGNRVGLAVQKVFLAYSRLTEEV